MDQIDQRIADIITERDQLSEEGKRLNNRVREAKDSFSFAFQQLKQAKQELKNKKAQLMARRDRRRESRRNSNLIDAHQNGFCDIQISQNATSTHSQHPDRISIVLS
jgi:uncharacterized coiled-coil DUF342 family protein